MSSRAEHYKKAEEMLADLEDTADTTMWGHGAKERLIAAAQVHATLATVPAAVSVVAKMDAEEEEEQAALAKKEQEWAKDWPPPAGEQ